MLLNINVIELYCEHSCSDFIIGLYNCNSGIIWSKIQSFQFNLFNNVIQSPYHELTSRCPYVWNVSNALKKQDVFFPPLPASSPWCLVSRISPVWSLQFKHKVSVGGLSSNQLDCWSHGRLLWRRADDWSNRGNWSQLASSASAWCCWAPRALCL